MSSSSRKYLHWKDNKFNDNLYQNIYLMSILSILGECNAKVYQ